MMSVKKRFSLQSVSKDTTEKTTGDSEPSYCSPTSSLKNLPNPWYPKMYDKPTLPSAIKKLWMFYISNRGTVFHNSSPSILSKAI